MYKHYVSYIEAFNLVLRLSKETLKKEFLAALDKPNAHPMGAEYIDALAQFIEVPEKVPNENLMREKYEKAESEDEDDNMSEMGGRDEDNEENSKYKPQETVEKIVPRGISHTFKVIHKERVENMKEKESEI